MRTITLIFSIALIGGCGKTPTPIVAPATTKQKAQKTKPVNLETAKPKPASKLTLLDYRLQDVGEIITGEDFVITGTVINNGEEAENPKITFGVYDTSGARIDEQTMRMNKLMPGEKWTFRSRKLSTKAGQLSIGSAKLLELTSTK